MKVFASRSRVWLSESHFLSWFSFRRGVIVFGCVSSSGLTAWKTVTVLTEVWSTSVLAAAQMYQDQLLGQQDTDLLLNYWCCPVCVCVDQWKSETERDSEWENVDVLTRPLLTFFVVRSSVCRKKTRWTNRQKRPLRKNPARRFTTNWNCSLGSGSTFYMTGWLYWPCWTGTVLQESLGFPLMSVVLRHVYG